MPVQVVPVIYDRASKIILRWYILDHDGQLTDPAFGAQGDAEAVMMVSLAKYRSLAGADPAKPLLHKLQEHVSAAAS